MRCALSGGAAAAADAIAMAVGDALPPRVFFGLGSYMYSPIAHQSSPSLPCPKKVTANHFLYCFSVSVYLFISTSR
jgi:hypothetical protein